MCFTTEITSNRQGQRAYYRSFKEKRLEATILAKLKKIRNFLMYALIRREVLNDARYQRHERDVRHFNVNK